MSVIAPEEPVANAVSFQRDVARVLVAREERAAGWQGPTMEGLLRMLLLAPNWNSHGARAVDASAVWAAWRLLTGVMEDDSPAPFVVPTVRGGVQLEWHRNGADLEVEVTGPHQFIASFEAEAAAESWESSGEVNPAALAAVREGVARLI